MKDEQKKLYSEPSKMTLLAKIMMKIKTIRHKHEAVGIFLLRNDYRDTELCSCGEAIDVSGKPRRG